MYDTKKSYRKREFRKYFIECEKQLKEVVQKPQTQLLKIVDYIMQ